MAGLAAALTGCCHIRLGHSSASCGRVCQTNLQAGVAILCQPMDVEVTTNNRDRVEFEVEATGPHPSFQWYFHHGSTDEVILKKREKYLGANMEKLIILNPSIDDVGFYYCEIDTTDSIGFPVRTATRKAALGLGFPRGQLLEYINTPVQPLPAPANTGAEGCLGENYCSAVTFKNGGAGYPAPGPNATCITVTLVNGQNTSVLPSGDYQMTAYDMNTGKTICLTSTTANQRCIIGTTGHSYLFAVYFNCSTVPKPAEWPQVLLTLGAPQ